MRWDYIGRSWSAHMAHRLILREIPCVLSNDIEE